MTLKQLEAFYWAATAINFQVAADHLHISLSALSKRVAELETHFGRALFDRSGHRAVLTSAGRQLLPMATRLLKMSHEIDSLLADEAGLVGHCRFGVGELAALTWLSDFIAQAGQRFPNVTLEPCVDLGSSLERRLREGELDFAVIAGHSGHGDLASHLIADVDFVWAAAPSLAGPQASLTPELLQRCSLITMPHGAGPTRMLEHWLNTNALESRTRLTCNNLSAVASLIVAGLGVGLFPRSWFEHLAPRGLVAELRTTSALPSMHYTFQHRRDDPRPLLAGLKRVMLGTADFNKPCPLW